MVTKTGQFCATRKTAQDFGRKDGLIRLLILRRTSRWRRGLSTWCQSLTNLAFVFVLLTPRLILSAEPTMDIFIDHSSMAISGISPQTVRNMAKVNDLGDPDQWPVYKTTGHPMYHLPASFFRHEIDHPEWDLKGLIEYRIAFRTYTKDKHEQRVVFLYQRKAKILFVLYVDMPEKLDDPNSPF
jgi:hypothetical protein